MPSIHDVGDHGSEDRPKTLARLGHKTRARLTRAIPFSSHLEETSTVLLELAARLALEPP